MSGTPTFNNPLGYTGIDPIRQPKFIKNNRAPTTTDYLNFEIGDEWLDIMPSPPELYKLLSVENNIAVWGAFNASSVTFGEDTILIGDGTITPETVGPLLDGQLLVGSSGNPPIPSELTAGTGISIVNTPGDITISTAGGVVLSADTIVVGEGTDTPGTVGPLTDGQLLIGSTGNAAVPSELVGGTGVSIVNSPGQITINSDSGTILTADTVLVGDGTDIPGTVGPLTDGQLLIGATGSAATPATLTAGTGISITDGAAAITISAEAGPAFTSNAILVGQGTPTPGIVGPMTNGELLIGSSGSAPNPAILTSSDASVQITNTAGGIDLKAIGSSPTAFIGFKATKTLTTTPVTGAGQLYTYTNYVESFDEGNVFNPTTGIFTAPEAAKFQFNVIANYQVINVSTSGFAQFNVTNAGGLPNQYFFVGNPINMRQGNGQLVLNGSALMDLPTNANVSLSVQFSGGLPTTRVSIIEFSAYKIG